MPDYVGSSLNNPITGLGRGGAIQPINASSSQVSGNDGTATFTFPYIALGQVWTVSANCAFAPDTALFTAFTGASNFGSWIGSNTWGAIQLGGGDQLVISAVGLIPNKTYQMQLLGSAVTGGEPGISTPGSYADSVTSSTEQLYFNTVNVASLAAFTPLVLTVQPRWRSIWLLFNKTNLGYGSITVLGNQSGTTYQAFVPPYTPSNTYQFYRYAIIAGIDTSVTVSITTQTFSYQMWYGADLAPVDTAVYSDTPAGLQVQNGVDTSGNTIPMVVTFAAGSGVTSFQTNMSGLSPQTASTGAVSLTGVLGVPNGGLNTTSTAVGAIPIGISTAAYSPLSIGANNTVLTSNGTTASWQSVTASAGVSSFSAGTTGFTPSGTTIGAVTLGGVLATSNGGLNTSTSPAVGSIPLGSSTSAYTPLAIGANNTVLTSNGTTASWVTPTSGGGGVTPTATKTTSYTAVASDYVVLNVSSAAVVTMPASPTNGATVGAINLATSTASVTFAAGAGATMNNTSVVLNSNQDAIWVYNTNTTSWLLQVWDTSNEYQVQGIMGFY